MEKDCRYRAFFSASVISGPIPAGANGWYVVGTMGDSTGGTACSFLSRFFRVSAFNAFSLIFVWLMAEQLYDSALNGMGLSFVPAALAGSESLRLIVPSWDPLP